MFSVVVVRVNPKCVINNQFAFSLPKVGGNGAANSYVISVVTREKRGSSDVIARKHKSDTQHRHHLINMALVNVLPRVVAFE